MSKFNDEKVHSRISINNKKNNVAFVWKQKNARKIGFGKFTILENKSPIPTAERIMKIRLLWK